MSSRQLIESIKHCQNIRFILVIIVVHIILVCVKILLTVPCWSLELVGYFRSFYRFFSSEVGFCFDFEIIVAIQNFI